jgi:hypothetical protein
LRRRIEIENEGYLFYSRITEDVLNSSVYKRRFPDKPERPPEKGNGIDGHPELSA